MDPLDIMANKDKIIPHFQPIYSADEQAIVGYEVLGRIVMAGEVRSLGAFFHDSSIPDEYHIEIDDEVLQKAVGKYLHDEKAKDKLLFINRNPNILMRDQGESFLAQLLVFKEQGLVLSNVVLEVTEHTFEGDIEHLNHCFTYYRTYGIQIALDNVGLGGSSIDRIRLLSPDLLKIDLQFLKSTTQLQSHQDVMYSLSLMARKIGATLLYEDLEDIYQLQFAWKNNGRYYQGYYLSTPSPELLEVNVCKEMLTKEFQRFIEHERNKLKKQLTYTEHFNELIEHTLLKWKNSQFNELIEMLSKQFDSYSFRVYICDENGFQQSYNIIKEKEGWRFQSNYFLKNWSWRPYFLENIVRMQYHNKGILSDLYCDIETGESIRTFSHPVGNGHYVFIDLSYTFLYENDGLLY